MTRFKDTSRHAAAAQSLTAARHSRTAPKHLNNQSYFRRIGFDHAMI